MLPDVGLLPDDFPEGYVRTFSLEGDRIPFADGISIPKTPFFGTMGNHPGEPRKNLPFPPHAGGGNMDNRHLQQGTMLWLPVLVPGAHFSVGDPHACQGDGEVSVARAGVPDAATLRFTLEKRTVECPQWRSPGALTPLTDAGGYHGTMGIADDLMEGARRAVRAMIGWLEEEHGLDRRGWLHALQPRRGPEDHRDRRHGDVECRDDDAPGNVRQVENGRRVMAQTSEEGAIRN